MGPVGGQLGRVELLPCVAAGVVAGVWGWVGGLSGARVAAAVARAAASATAYGIESPLLGASSHLDLFCGLPSTWSPFLLDWADGVWLEGLDGEGSGVLGVVVPGPLLPALLHSRGTAAACDSSAPAAAATCCSSTPATACCWLATTPAVPFEVGPEKLFVSLFVIFRLVLLGSG